MLVSSTKSYEIGEKYIQESFAFKKPSWGLIVTQTSRQLDFVEALLRVLGALFLVVSLVTLLLILGRSVLMGGFHYSDGLLRELLAGSTFAAAGLALRYFGLIGIRKQLEVDSKQGELRLGYQQSDRHFRLKLCISSSDLISAFVLKATGTKPARLVLRLRSASNPLVVLNGPEDKLRFILEYITNMTNGMIRNNYRKTKTDRLLHMKFD